jgi:hypothetical protein
MSHFALIDENDIVVNVLVIEQDVIDMGEHGSPDSFVQTSYNTCGGIHKLGGTPFRKNFAVIGGKYDRVRDAFIPPQDFPSWTLNEFSCLWEAPVPMPTDGKPYYWDEPSLSWVEIVVPSV